MMIDRGCMGMKWDDTRLKNGIRFLTEQNPEETGICAGFFFPAGTADDRPGEKGALLLWTRLMLHQLNQGLAYPVWSAVCRWDRIAFTAGGDPVQGEKLVRSFLECQRSPAWTEQLLTQEKKALSAGTEQERTGSFYPEADGEYWKNSSYQPPMWDAAAGERLTLETVKKAGARLCGQGNFFCLLCGKLVPGVLEGAKAALESAVFSEKALKPQPRVLPEEFGKRKKRTEWIQDTAETQARVEISFDVVQELGWYPVQLFWRGLQKEKEQLALPEELKKKGALRDWLELRRAGSRLVIACAVPSDELITALRWCFAVFSKLKKKLQNQAVMEEWLCSQPVVTGSPENRCSLVGDALCFREKEAVSWLTGTVQVRAEDLSHIAGTLFRPSNLTVSVCANPGMVKRKKLQKVLQEGRILLQSSETGEEEQESLNKKLLHQYIRDCQAELDWILQQEKGGGRSAYLLWKKFQCYVRYRRSRDSHYSFEDVQGFLLGHGYSKDDVKKLKKWKDKEKKEDSWVRQERPEDDLEQIIRWFQEDTCAMLRRLPDWEGAAAAAVKRSNLLMKREGKSERGLEAVKVLLQGEAGDLAPLKKWIQQREEKEAREAKETKEKTAVKSHEKS